MAGFLRWICIYNAAKRDICLRYKYCAPTELKENACSGCYPIYLVIPVKFLHCYSDTLTYFGTIL